MSVSSPYVSCIGGRWRTAAGAPVIARENPGRPAEVAAHWCPATAADAGAALTAAAAAQPEWSAVPLAKRIALLTDLLAAVEARAAEFAAIITAESGKLLRESHAEIKSGLADSRHALAEAAQLGIAETISRDAAPVRSEVVLEPVGPCLLVTPWNFPLATILRKLVPALAYGNTAVVKPSELTPGPAHRLFSLLAGSSLPAGAASLVLGSGAEIVPALASQPALKAISFTGSTAAGTAIARHVAERDIRLQLEMGGKNSLIVLAEADLEAAVEAAMVGAFSCAGQWCTGTGRVIVEQAVLNEFTERLAARAALLRAGPGDAEGFDLGAVVSPARLEFAQAAVAGAVSGGARVRCGGRVLPGGYFFTPTVLDRVGEDLPVFTDELFVPVLPVIAAHDAADAVRLANSGRYGLSASVFSRDTTRAAELARSLEAGLVHVNLHTAYREPALPVGGWRESGRGLPECGRFSRDFFTRPRAFYLRS